jgi:hypothetical protein
MVIIEIKAKRRPRFDRRLTMDQAREIRASALSGPQMVALIKERYGVSMSHVAIWKIRHHQLYRELPRKLEE